MTWRQQGVFSKVALIVAGTSLSLFGAAGCVTVPTLPVEAAAYTIDVRLDPASHRLVGRTDISLVRTNDRVIPAGEQVAVELLLHPALRIEQVTADGVPVKHRRGRLVVKDDDDDGEDDFVPRKHYIILEEPPDSFTLSVTYKGKLFQDVSAGEVAGAIHNFQMRAHIGKDGIYLGGGYWYPEPACEEDAVTRLADFIVLADRVGDIELVAGAERDSELSDKTGRLAWRSPYPLDGMVLVGGPHEVHRIVHNGVEISLHLKPSQVQQAEGLFEAVVRYLDRYEPLIGPYPAREFAIVDNFFSSGFAFPTFTLLSSAVIDMGERSQKAHGYIDHEVLHSWWGNGVHVDPDDGNWCEALASYGANYYGYILDEDETQARRKRRNYAHFLSRLKPQKDKPLGTYGKKDGCGRGIAYSKGAAVFHMLARKVGQDAFWAAMRRLTAEYVGRYASWDDIRRLCEEQSGVSLETFFRQWVRSGGAPALVIDHARYDSAARTLTLSLQQGEPAFELDVPIRITHAGGTLDVAVGLDAASDEITIPVDVVPEGVEVDPDYHIFRKVPKTDIIPTTATTRTGDAFTCILPAGDVHEQYATVQSTFEKSFEEDERNEVKAGNVDVKSLADRSVLILGEAVRDPAVEGFLEALDFPVRWTDTGFSFEGVDYADAGHGLICTIVHPGEEVRGVTVVLGNGVEGIPKARNVPFYDRSLVIFADGKPIVRYDFEPRHVIPVQHQ